MAATPSGQPAPTARRSDRTWLIALAASLWGFSGVLRAPLSKAYPAATIVLWEHLVLVALLLPWLIPAVRALATSSRRTRVSVLVIGAGSSALATTLFTAAFRLGDPITPQVLQKLQPVLALVFAAVLLGERLRASFAVFALPALAGAWLLAFPDPLGIGVRSAAAAALGLGAAALWAAGTVLGRAASAELSFVHLTTLRFAVGLISITAIVAGTGAPLTVGTADLPRLVALAVVPGLLALVLYYLALRRTPASRATLAELAFPITAAVVGVSLLQTRLSGSQWLGAGVVLVSVVALALHEYRSPTPAVDVPDDAGLALAPISARR